MVNRNATFQLELTSPRGELSKNVSYGVVAPREVHCKQNYVAFLSIFAATFVINEISTDACQSGICV